MSDFVLWVRRASLAVAIVALAAGAGWADEPTYDGADESLEAPQVEDNGSTVMPVVDSDGWIFVGNPPAGNPPPAGPPTINVDDQGNPLVTPEPATLVLLTTGAAGTVIARWRKRGC